MTLGQKTDTEVSELVINGVKVLYVGKPLSAMNCHLWKGEESWSGRGNILIHGQTKPEHDLIDLDDCFVYLKRWVASERLPYVCGYVLDYENKTIYYDTPKALTFALEMDIIGQDISGYFTKFVQRSFGENTNY